MNPAKSRIFSITALLVGLGALLGALCGTVIVVALLTMREGPSVILDGATWSFLVLPAQFGAATGAITGPLFAWALLRHVPLGRAIRWTALGTIAGAVIGELTLPFNPYVRDVPALILGGLAGFVIAGTAVRLRTPRRQHAEIIEPAV